MTYTDISLCSKALIQIGAEGISSFEEGTAEAEVAANLYSLVRDSVLSAYPWSFAVAQAKLARLNSAPLADYAYEHTLPADYLRVISVGCGCKGFGVDYRICEGKIHSNQKDITLTYIYRPLEKDFPPFFADALTAKLAAEFCLPITQDVASANALVKVAEEKMKAARLTDAQQTTPKQFQDFSLVEVR